jgi:hypothetical protein
MTVPKNDTYKDYVRYAEHCLNMMAGTTSKESRRIQREMAAEWRANANGIILARKQNGPRAKGLPVEYRDIRYTVRARIERDEWAVSIHPADIESPRAVVTGREKAERLARYMIDRWHVRRGAERSKKR